MTTHLMNPQYSPLSLKALVVGLSILAGLTTLNGQDDPNLSAYDGLDYPKELFPFPFNSLEGNNGGTGWASAWLFRADMPLGKGDRTQYSSFIIDPLPYTGVLTTSGNSTHLRAETGSVEFARQLAEPITGTAGTRTYISFIGQRTGPVADPAGAPYNDPELFPNGYPTPNNLYPRGAALRIFDNQGGEVMQIGHYSEVFGTEVNESARNTWELAAGDIIETDAPFDVLSFVVVRIDHNGDDTVADSVYVWINPDLSKGELTGEADIQLPNWTIEEMVEGVPTMVARDFSDIKYLGPWAGNASGNRPYAELFFDELRVGKTWESVTPGGAVVPKYGPWPIVSGAYVDSATFLGWLNITGQPWLWNLTMNKYMYIPESYIQGSGAWVYIPNPTPGPGGEGTWAGWPIVTDSYVDTGDFFGWVNVAGGDWVWSVVYNKYIYMPESFVQASGGWAYIPL